MTQRALHMAYAAFRGNIDQGYWAVGKLIANELPGYESMRQKLGAPGGQLTRDAYYSHLLFFAIQKAEGANASDIRSMLDQ